MLRRVFDFSVATVLLGILSPVMLLIAVQIRRKLGSPVLFRQPRVGLDNAVFELVKFRSMSIEKNSEEALLADELRLSSFGLWLRRTSLDELPTLWNVWRGDMSLVGPRPLLVEYLPRYSSYQARRHEVKPGITGWAQVNGRNSLSWKRRFEHDVWYVDHHSMRLDIVILARTVLQVLRRDGINAEGSATMPLFVGEGRDTDKSL